MLKVVDHYLIFNGKSTLDFDAIIDGNQTFGSPERDYETFEIPGRNGNLTIDNGRFAEVSLPYSGFIVKDFQDNASALRNFLLSDPGYHRLEDSIHPDEYRTAMFAGPFDPSVVFLEAGRFTLTFKARPERWLKSGEHEIEITGSSILLNPTYFTAKPMIEVVSGTGELTVGDTILTIKQNPGNMMIDCEIEDVFKDSENLNSLVEQTTGGFPELKSGQTTVAVSNGMTIKIIPRWWII